MKIIFLLIIFTILNFVGMSQVKENNVMDVSDNMKHYLSDDYLVADRSFDKRDNKKTKPSDKSNNEDKKKVSDSTKNDINKTKTNLNKVDSNTDKKKQKSVPEKTVETKLSDKSNTEDKKKVSDNTKHDTNKTKTNLNKVDSNTDKVVFNIDKVDSKTDKAVSDTDKKKQKSVPEKPVEQDSYEKEEVDNDNVSEDKNYNVSDDSSDDDTIGIEMGPFSVLIGGTYLPITNDATQARIDRADQELVNWGSNYTPSKTIGDGSSLYLAVESSGYGSLMYSNPQSITFSDSNNDVSEYNLVGVHGPYNYKRYFDDNWVSAVIGEQGEAIFIQTCISADSSYKIWEYRR